MKAKVKVEEPVTIDASPTKDLFIEMLTRDVPLLWAILDVVDNSVDAAKARAKANKSGGDLSAFKIEITVGKAFEILDNCGGMSRTDAIEHAFRFGRDSKNPATPYSVGQFGVGMKRTLFKLGNDFIVDSRTLTETFRVKENVPKWRNKPEWKFQIEETPTTDKLARVGTRIRVINLHEMVLNSFQQQTFVNELREEICRSHFMSIERGLKIDVNEESLTVPELSLRSSQGISAFHKRMEYKTPDGKSVMAEIWAGVSGRDPRLSGWYVFCNERMVLAADQTITTGWGEGGGHTVPRFHNDFAFFRGYVMFLAEDPKLLPWTSMKTGVDTDSKVYVWCREQMVSAMKSVTKVLREVVKERSARNDACLADGKLTKAVDTGNEVRFRSLHKESDFSAPSAEMPQTGAKKDDSVKIMYYRPKDQVAQVKASLGLRSAAAVGEATFDFYLKYGI